MCSKFKHVIINFDILYDNLSKKYILKKCEKVSYRYGF